MAGRVNIRRRCAARYMACYTAWCERQVTGPEAGLGCGHRIAGIYVLLVAVVVVCRVYWGTVKLVLLSILVALCVALAVLIGLGIRRLYSRAALLRERQARAAELTAARQHEADMAPRWPDKPLQADRRTADGRAVMADSGQAPGQQVSGRRTDGPAPAALDNRAPGQDEDWWTEFEQAHQPRDTGRARSAEQERGSA